MICLIFWLIFSILGVQLFGGRFARCLHRDTLDIVNYSVVNNRTQCCEIDLASNMTLCDVANNQSGIYLWEDTNINFNHVGMASIALFQVATFEGWMEVMASAADAVGIDQQPRYEHQFGVYFFFAAFIIIGAFFVLNLFIGVIIDQFNSQKKKSEETGEGGGLLLTESQKRYVRAMAVLMLRPKPKKEITPPTNKFRLFLFKMCTAPAFETCIIVAILLNSIVFATRHDGQSEEFSKVVFLINATFTILFLIEAVIKIVALGTHYFKDNWNKFDLLIVLLSMTGLILDIRPASSLEENFSPVAPVLARVFRVARVLRLAKSVKFASNIKKLLIVMMHSAPALLNIGTLIFMVMFIFSVVGMSLFKFVKHNGVINDYSNMETFPRALQLLFRLCTSAGWNDVTDAYSLEEPHCDAFMPDTHETRGNCGSPTTSQLYFTGYILLSYVIMVNMYIAVILDNMVELVVQSVTEQGIPAHAFDDFYRSWVKYDRKATQFVAHHHLCDLLSSVPRPLGFAHESCTERDLGDLAIPLYVDGDAVLDPPKAHVGDVLDALVQRYHQVDTFEEDSGGKELRALMFEKLGSKFPIRKTFGNIQGDTHAYYLMTKCIVTIQRAWRKRKNIAKPLETLVFRDRLNLYNVLNADNARRSSQSAYNDDVYFPAVIESKAGYDEGSSPEIAFRIMEGAETDEREQAIANASNDYGDDSPQPLRCLLTRL